MGGLGVHNNLIENDAAFTQKSYAQLTSKQKNKADMLLERYSKQYVKAPSVIDKACFTIQRKMSYRNMMLIMSIMKSNANNFDGDRQ